MNLRGDLVDYQVGYARPLLRLIVIANWVLERHRVIIDVLLAVLSVHVRLRDGLVGWKDVDVVHNRAVDRERFVRKCVASTLSSLGVRSNRGHCWLQVRSIYPSKVMLRHMWLANCCPKCSCSLCRIWSWIYKACLPLHFPSCVLDIPALNVTVRVDWLKWCLSSIWVKLVPWATPLSEFRWTNQDLGWWSLMLLLNGPVVKRTGRLVYI